MFLTTGVSGGTGPTGGVPEYQTSQEGGTEYTVYEGVESGAGAYAGPSMNHMQPLTNDYAPQPLLTPVYAAAPPAVPQGPNPYINTLGGSVLAPTPMATTPTTKDDCGCGGDCTKLPWYVLVGLVVAVVLLMRD